MTDPDDEMLTTQGLPAGGAGRILLIACGALAHEILALKRVNGWDHMDLHCLPAKLHLYPDRITPEVEKAVTRHRADYARIFVVYADCGTGGQLQAKCAELGVEMVVGRIATRSSKGWTGSPRTKTRSRPSTSPIFWCGSSMPSCGGPLASTGTRNCAT